VTSLSERQRRLLERTFLDYQPLEPFLEAPFIVERADGVYYWDTAGKRYFDAIGGIFVAVLGHNHPRVVAALTDQLQRLAFAPPMHGISDVALDLVETLGAVAPGDLNFVKSFSGGSESIEAALKFARQYWRQSGRPNKYKFVSRYQAYHGATMGAMAASGTGPRKTPFAPEPSGFIKVLPPTLYRDRFPDWQECNRFAASAFEDVIVHEDPETVAAVIVEPIGNTGGIITPTEEYFRLLREICDRHEVLLIFDEVITGYGKTGAMFAAQSFGVTPDIICAGKSLSSGVIPLGAMLARADLADAFRGDADAQRFFAHGHTFANHPLACAVGIAVVDEIRTAGLEARALEIGARLQTRLEQLARFGVVREVRGRGVIRGVELVRDTAGLQPFPELGSHLKRTAMEHGLVMRVDPTWFAVCPPLVASDDEIDEMCDLIDASLQAALDSVAAGQRVH
jgi:adenosylmethionine-8-amino-7-oxononanoate aminotransferase